MLVFACGDHCKDINNGMTVYRIVLGLLATHVHWQSSQSRGKRGNVMLSNPLDCFPSNSGSQNHGIVLLTTDSDSQSDTFVSALSIHTRLPRRMQNVTGPLKVAAITYSIWCKAQACCIIKEPPSSCIHEFPSNMAALCTDYQQECPSCICPTNSIALIHL
jgi:hypothetical protein